MRGLPGPAATTTNQRPSCSVLSPAELGGEAVRVNQRLYTRWRDRRADPLLPGLGGLTGPQRRVHHDELAADPAGLGQEAARASARRWP